MGGFFQPIFFSRVKKAGAKERGRGLGSVPGREAAAAFVGWWPHGTPGWSQRRCCGMQIGAPARGEYRIESE